MRFILQLINDISRVLQKLFKYLNSTIILTASVPKDSLEPVIFCLYLNKALSPEILSRTSVSVKG